MGRWTRFPEDVRRWLRPLRPATSTNIPSARDLLPRCAALKELLDELDANDVVFAFAELGPVWDQLRQYGLAQRIGEDHRFPTIGTVVTANVRRTGTHWVDPVPD